MTFRYVPHLNSRASGIRAALFGALLWALPCGVRAEDAADAVDLTWNAPADCPSSDAVLQHVRELAGPALRNAERLRASGRIVRVDGRYELTLTVYDKGKARERTMTARSCVDLAGAAGVALGLLIRQGSPASPPSAGA